MKWINLILSVYMLSLLCMPCSDVEECDSIAFQTVQNTQDHSQHEHERENCNPFCTCTCCGSQVYNYYTPYYSVNGSFTQSDKAIAIYQFSFPSDFCANIWQPPKIG